MVRVPTCGVESPRYANRMCGTPSVTSMNVVTSAGRATTVNLCQLHADRVWAIHHIHHGEAIASNGPIYVEVDP